MFNDGTIYENFCVDDAGLTFENYEELFGTPHIQTEQLFDDAGIDSYFGMKEMPAADCNEVCSFCKKFSLSIIFAVVDKNQSYLPPLVHILEVVMSSSLVEIQLRTF